MRNVHLQPIAFSKQEKMLMVDNLIDIKILKEGELPVWYHTFIIFA